MNVYNNVNSSNCFAHKNVIREKRLIVNNEQCLKLANDFKMSFKKMDKIVRSIQALIPDAKEGNSYCKDSKSTSFEHPISASGSSVYDSLFKKAVKKPQIPKYDRVERFVMNEAQLGRLNSLRTEPEARALLSLARKWQAGEVDKDTLEACFDALVPTGNIQDNLKYIASKKILGDGDAKSRYNNTLKFLNADANENELKAEKKITSIAKVGGKLVKKEEVVITTVDERIKASIREPTALYKPIKREASNPHYTQIFKGEVVTSQDDVVPTKIEKSTYTQNKSKVTKPMRVTDVTQMIGKEKEISMCSDINKPIDPNNTTVDSVADFFKKVDDSKKKKSNVKHR